VLEKYLIKGGLGVLSGAPGVGKSQFTLDMCSHLVLGRDFLGQKVHVPCKIGFLSLEMGEVTLGNILKHNSSMVREQTTVEDRMVPVYWRPYIYSMYRIVKT
jgi:RecA-family ATPase